ncbi:MAG: glycosyltransferase family 2 protein [Myxococcota bacterium]|jgi:glycosyltransferase involved in cell wall biosynthesis|nr:glycosyltransferase family 2 protein [Myxococcota bacterium]
MIQIPCLNEEGTLPATLDDIPREVEGIDCVEVVIIDDGCTDRTVEVAREHGADHVVKFAQNRGLGHAFSAGMDFCLQQGADIIINTDGDNQYYGGDIPKLVAPILAGKAELVIGDREPGKVEHFSPVKKLLQSVGSRVMSRLAGLEVPDVASGFKAYSREAAMRLVMSTDFDHTVDHVIQAGRKRIPTVSVPIRTNDKLRESRLFSNVSQFITRSLKIAVRVYSTYGAMAVFSAAGAVTFTVGFAVGLRFLYFFVFTGSHDLHVQSLILAAILMLAGFQMVLTGIVADLISSSRGILEDVSYRLRRLEDGAQPSDADTDAND